MSIDAIHNTEKDFEEDPNDCEDSIVSFDGFQRGRFSHWYINLMIQIVIS